MIGQFPDGIALHCKNLRWALTEKDHSFIITLPEYIERFGLKNDNYFTYIAFETDGKDRFINFWGKFPEMVNQMGILPEWFLLMEQDIWFHKPLGEFGMPERNSQLLAAARRISCCDVGRHTFAPTSLGGCEPDSWVSNSFGD
jgi:hypothetical protein